MASSASTVLRQEIMTNGENDASWGTKTNLNLNILESAITGTTSISTTGGTTTLANADYVNDQAKKAVLDVSGVLVSNAIIVIPNASKTFKVFNRTSGAFTVTIKTATGSGIVITQSTTSEIYCNGSDVVRFATSITDYVTGAPATSSGAAASTVSVVPTGNLASSNAQSALVELQSDVDTINAALISSYQPLDAGLTDIAGIATSKGNMILGNGTNFAALGVGTNGFSMIADSASATGAKWAALVPAGTVALFYQAAAPVGWTVSDADNNKAIRIVSGASGLGGAAGGATAFTSVFSSRTITQANLPNYTLPDTITLSGSQSGGLARNLSSTNFTSPGGGAVVCEGIAFSETTLSITGSVTSGGSGTAMDFDVQYISVIKCAKDAY